MHCHSQPVLDQLTYQKNSQLYLTPRPPLIDIFYHICYILVNICYILVNNSNMKKIICTIIIFFSFGFSFTAKSNDLNRAYLALEKKDYKTAIYFLSYYANLGNAKAQYNYAIMLKNGLGTKKDPNEAFKWFFLSADQGNMLANYAIGQSYFKGAGVKKNYKLALESFKKAALMGHASSKINLGSIYYFGYGINKNHPKAYLWWRLALDQNCRPSTLIIIGVSQNRRDEKS